MGNARSVHVACKAEYRSICRSVELTADVLFYWCFFSFLNVPGTSEVVVVLILIFGYVYSALLSAVASLSLYTLGRGNKYQEDNDEKADTSEKLGGLKKQRQNKVKPGRTRVSKNPGTSQQSETTKNLSQNAPQKKGSAGARRKYFCRLKPKRRSIPNKHLIAVLAGEG